MFHHKLGTSQDEDTLIYEDKNQPNWHFSTLVTDDGQYLILTTTKSAANIKLKHYADISKMETFEKPIVFTPIIGEWIGGFSLIYSVGTKFYFKTNLNAPKEKVISIDISQPAQENWRDVIPESENVLSEINYIGDKFVAKYMINASDQLMVYDNGQEG